MIPAPLPPPPPATFAIFTRHGSGRSIAVRRDAVLAVECGVAGQDQHKAALHIGEAHPLRVSDSYADVIKRLGWGIPA